MIYSTAAITADARMAADAHRPITAVPAHYDELRRTFWERAYRARPAELDRIFESSEVEIN